MPSDLILHEMTGSPNSVKVRMALGLKGLAYERRPIDMTSEADRQRITELSTQPMVPVLEHGGADRPRTVIFDSGAILRYLEANFPDTPRLFSSVYPEQRQIEGWEQFQKTVLGPPVGALFGKFFEDGGQGTITEGCAAIAAEMNAATAELEQALAESDYLCGDRPTAGDVACAAYVHLAMLPRAGRGISPIADYFMDNFDLGEGPERTRAWVLRLRAHDEVLGPLDAAASEA